MAWNRVVRIGIGPGDRNPGDANGLLISDLDLTFRVKRSILFDDGTAEVTVFNANESTRAFLSGTGLNMIIDVGYEDTGLGTIFIGQVVKVMHSHGGADWTTKIRATCGRPVLKRLEATVVSYSYGPGVRLSQVLTDVATGLGLVAMGTENVESVILRNGLHHCGRIQPLYTRLRTECTARQVGIYIDFNQMVLYKKGTPADYSIVFLTSDSGLRSVKPMTSASEQAVAFNAKSPKHHASASDLRNRIQFTSILLPKIRPNSLVRIESSDSKGDFLVEVIEYQGDNMGKDWQITAEATNG